MVLLRAMTRSSVAVFLLSVAWSFLCMKDASAFSVPLPRIFETFFSSFSNCSLAISWGSFILERCTALTLIGFNRRSPCKVVSDGRLKEGLKNEASKERAAMFALLLCFVVAGLLNVEVVPQSPVSMVANAAPRGVSVLGGLSDCCLCPRGSAARAARREQAALGDGCLKF